MAAPAASPQRAHQAHGGSTAGGPRGHEFLGTRHPALGLWREGLPVLDAEGSRTVERLRRDLNSGVGSNLNHALAHANAAVRGGGAVDGDALLAAVTASGAALEALRADLQRLLGPQGRV